MTKDLNYGGVWNYASRFIGPCPSGRMTADTKEIRDFPKLLCATCFVHQPLCDSLSYSNKALGFWLQDRGYE
jgi:hypothetical protein